MIYVTIYMYTYCICSKIICGGGNKMGKVTKFIVAWAIIATIVFCAWSTVRIVKFVQFDMNCTQYIKRAADANTVELAKEELAKAISYAEKNNLTEGVVSIFLHQPKNDVGYWYKNMTQSYSELDKLSGNATSLEKSNVLMRLREALTDNNESGVSVTIPDGISIYPKNIVYFWWGVLSFVFCLCFWCIAIIAWWFNWN